MNTPHAETENGQTENSQALVIEEDVFVFSWGREGGIVGATVRVITYLETDHLISDLYLSNREMTVQKLHKMTRR
jgi:hypothetical protein